MRYSAAVELAVRQLPAVATSVNSYSRFALEATREVSKLLSVAWLSVADTWRSVLTMLGSRDPEGRTPKLTLDVSTPHGINAIRGEPQRAYERRRLGSCSYPGSLSLRCCTMLFSARHHDCDYDYGSQLRRAILRCCSSIEAES